LDGEERERAREKNDSVDDEADGSRRSFVYHKHRMINLQ